VIQLSLPEKANGEPLRVLCLGAHSDDIEIGCGGTILWLRNQYPAAEFHWVVFSAAGIRSDEARTSAKLFAGPGNLRGPVLKAFRDGFLPFEGARVKDFFEELKLQVSPDLIFTHTQKDAHQDHRLVSDLTWNTFRDHVILEYEIPKYDGDMGRPNVFVPLATEHHEKVANIMDTFRSQHSKRWFQPETFLAVMRLRGMECNAPSGYAEAFYCRKLVLRPWAFQKEGIQS
jgi:LmbE family N-acetylglucosaminyl deacetylase